MHRALQVLSNQLSAVVKPCSYLYQFCSRTGTKAPCWFGIREKSYSCRNVEKQDAKTIHVNVLPIWTGQRKQGVRYGPAIMSSIAQEVSDGNSNLVTNHFKDNVINNVDGRGSEEAYTSHMNELSREISSSLTELKPGDTVLNLGGDHSVAMATVQTMYNLYPDLRVVWIDAHADINSPETSPSGNFHGMPVYYFSDLSDANKNSGRVSVKNIKYIGVRDVDDGEMSVMRKNSIRNYTSNEVVTRGTDAIAIELITDLELMRYPVHISFDIDSIDPAECPSTGTRAPNGLSVSTVLELIRQIKDSGNLVSIDIVEFNPLIGSDSDVEKTVESIRRVMEEVVR